MRWSARELSSLPTEETDEEDADEGRAISWYSCIVTVVDDDCIITDVALLGGVLCTDEEVVEPIDELVEVGDGCALLANTAADGRGGTDGAALRAGGARLGGGVTMSEFGARVMAVALLSGS